MIAKAIMLFERHPISIFILLLVALIALDWWILCAYREQQNKREKLSWRKHLNAIRFGQDTHY